VVCGFDPEGNWMTRQDTLRRVCAMPLLDVHDHRTQLVLVGVGAALATASLLSAFNTHNKKQRRRNLDKSIKSSLAESRTTDVLPTVSELDLQVKNTDLNDVSSEKHASDVYVYDEDLIREQLARNYAFFGDESMSKVRGASVVIVGCGGVGSWAAVMLARSYALDAPSLLVFLDDRLI